jgi:hypothetical protein
MELIGTYSSYIVAGMTIGLFLVACAAILVAMRQQASGLTRLVTRSIRCPQRQEAAVVTFIERLRRGRVMRSMQSCSLLDVGERCSEVCARDLPAEGSGLADRAVAC